MIPPDAATRASLNRVAYTPLHPDGGRVIAWRRRGRWLVFRQDPEWSRLREVGVDSAVLDLHGEDLRRLCFSLAARFPNELVEVFG